MEFITELLGENWQAFTYGALGLALVAIVARIIKKNEPGKKLFALGDASGVFLSRLGLRYFPSRLSEAIEQKIVVPVFQAVIRYFEGMIEGLVRDNKRKKKGGGK